MATLMRSVNRVLFTQWRAQTTGNKSKYLQEVDASEKHAHSAIRLWKRVAVFVAVPGLILSSYNAYVVETEHLSHGRPEFVPYIHLRLRTKPFPWGDGNHSLLHNPHTNPLPEGYEE